MSYPVGQDLRYNNKQPIKAICDECGGCFDLLYKSAEKNKKKHGKHKCCNCTGITPKPQNSSVYWTKDRRANQSTFIKSSEKYQEAIADRDLSGDKNPMYGKSMTKESKQRMSISRTGKIGSQATAWKGGKSSVTKRVKGIIHGRHDWYGKVFKRDGWKCVECGSKTKIEAHHIDPVNKIIKRLCESRSFDNEDDKVSWLVEQPELVDFELKNGKTLCRKCHKKEHKNWGSHECG